jgi:hypothetical protein
MAITLIMQDLVTVTLTASGQTITQAENLWVDLAAYQDLAINIYYAQAPTTLSFNAGLFIETAPLKEEAIFMTFPIVSVTTAPATVPGWYGVGAFHLGSSNGFGRYLRWRVANGTYSGTNTWQFRIVLTVNPSP